MNKPPKELIDAFLTWYANDPHSKNEDFYLNKITKANLSGLGKKDFIDFFYQFAHEGGKVQSGGYRTSGKFRETIETLYDQFRLFVLSPFESDFDTLEWLAKTKDFRHFGSGLATIYLNRVDKARFPILNNKTSDGLKLHGVKLPADIKKRYKAVVDAQKKLIDWFPQFENFYRVDALNQFLIGEEEGESWKKQLSNGTGQVTEAGYWIFQGNPKYYDAIGALRDRALKTWSVRQHKQEIKAGDKVIIWIVGKNSGCYGLATVASEVQPFKEDAKEASYRVTPTEKEASDGVMLHIDHNLWNAPMFKEEIDDLPGFSDFPVERQGTNSTFAGANDS